jgi:hypothetical protein
LKAFEEGKKFSREAFTNEIKTYFDALRKKCFPVCMEEEK